MSVGHIIGAFFLIGLIVSCFITAWGARNSHEVHLDWEFQFRNWYRDCQQYAYREGYSSSAVENFSIPAFQDYFNVGMTPSEAVNEYFSKH